MSTTATTQPTDETTEAQPFVRVAVLAGDTTQLDYQPGLTVQQALDAAGARVGAGQLVTVNGAPAQFDQVLEPNTALVVAGRTANG